MRSLFIDTHSNQMKIALFEKQQLVTKKELAETQNNSAICMPTIVEILKESKITIKDINEVIVVNGPGSFTGVRIGVTISKTLSYTLNIPIKTLTSFELFEHDENFDYIVLAEKNGYYIATKNLENFQYLTKGEYENWKLTHKYKEYNEINYNQIIQNASKKEALYCHGVKPLYIKKIEVEK